jgi:hypothetical protein
MNAIITFTPDGTGHTLYTEIVDLALLGRLSIKRASSIEFDNSYQTWRVFGTDGRQLYEAPSRQACLEWERTHLEEHDLRGTSPPL